MFKIKNLSALLLTIVLLISLFNLQQVVSIGLNSHEVTMPIPAVAQSGEKTYGVISYLTVRVVPGSGHIYIETWPLSEIDMQASARIAANIAYEIASKLKDLGSLDDWDFLYSITTETPIIGGPSAGAAMTIATIGALLGIDPKPNIIITGMINPDGTIGAVGGIIEKIDAAASINATVFLAPYGQTHVNKTILEKYTIGPFTYYRTKTITINVSKYAKEKYGIEVNEVFTIYDAIKYFYNLEINDTIGNLPLYRSCLSFYYINPFLRNSSVSTLKAVREYFNETLSRMDVLSRILYSEDIERVEYLINTSEKLITQGLYYSALSLLFQANVTISYLNNIVEYHLLGEDYIKDITNEINKTIGHLLNITANKENITDGIIAAQVRLLDAINSLENAGKYYQSGDIDTTLREISYAEERVKTVTLWLNYTGALFSSQDLIKNFEDEFSFSLLLYAYINSMYGEEYSQNILSYLTLSEKAHSLGLYGAAYLYALEARTYAETFLDLIGISSNYILDKMSYVKYITLENINSSINKRNISPIIALFYIEYAYYFTNANQIENAFIFLKLANTWSSIYLKYGKPVQGNFTYVELTQQTVTSEHENKSIGEHTTNEYAGSEEYRGIIVAVLMFVVFIITIYLIRRD